jgi:hypothetical protein
MHIFSKITLNQRFLQNYVRHNYFYKFVEK